jgi:hypothetical protein
LHRGRNRGSDHDPSHTRRTLAQEEGQSVRSRPGLRNDRHMLAPQWQVVVIAYRHERRSASGTSETQARGG